MKDSLRIAKELVRLARNLVGKELVITSADGGGSLVDSVDDVNSAIGNKTDKRFPYDIWAIDLKSVAPGTAEFGKVKRLIDEIQRNPLKKWILWTANENVGELEDFCRRQGFTPDAVNDNVKEVKDFYKANSRKVYAQHYVDMRNVDVNNVTHATGLRKDGRKTVYAIDFDGTIAETDNTFPEIERPIGKIVDFIRNFIQPDPNREWVLYTCRVGEPEKIAERWCRENELFPVAVNSNARKHGNRKLNADYYIDDRNVDLSKMQ